MSNSVTVAWSGMEEFRAALRQLPESLHAEGAEIAHQAVNHASAEIASGYRGHTSLSERMRQQDLNPGEFGVRIVLKNTAPHSFWWDHGTEARHYITKYGKIHKTGDMWGRSAPQWTFTRGAAKWRRWMYDRMRAMLVREGLLVSGEP